MQQVIGGRHELATDRQQSILDNLAPTVLSVEKEQLGALSCNTFEIGDNGICDRGKKNVHE